MNIFDHSKAVKDLLKASVNCYMSKGTADALEIIEHHRVGILKSGYSLNISGWLVLSFALQHDAAEPYGFLIADDREAERFLFIPDTAYVKPRFGGITLAAIECNHIEDILTKNILSGNLPPIVGHRVRRNHMSLETLISMLKANDLSRCRQIFLLHLSSGNSDEKKMVKEVQMATGIPCIAC